jgi:ParB family transcriptional regulator, chromosome partitioning protein
VEPSDNKPSQLKDIPVDRTQASPFQVRSDFDEAPLADSLDQGLANPILVRPITPPAGQSGEWYELVDGERRLRAHKLKGKTLIRAIVEDMADEEAETKVLIANMQRKALNPIEEARGFERMEKRGKPQREIARIFGRTRMYINEALRLLDLPVEVQGGVARATLTPSAALLLLRLPSPEQQKEIGVRAAKEKWTVKKAEQEVQKALRKDPSPGLRPPSPLGRGKGEAQGEAASSLPDPFAATWASLSQNGLNPSTYWEVKFGAHPQIKKHGWFFFVSPYMTNSQVDLADWFKQVEQALSDAQGAGAQKTPQATAPKNKNVNERVTDMWMPKNAAEAEHMKASPLTPRLPDTPEEWARVEALAPSGLGAVYGWMLGDNSYWTKKASALTWQDLDATDPIAGCHKIIEALRQGRTSKPVTQSSAPASPPQAAAAPAPKARPVRPKPIENPLLEGLDPETRALVEAEFKKGPLI